MRIYREGLAWILGREGRFTIVGSVARIGDLTQLLGSAQVDVVLFDLSVDGGLSSLRRLRMYPARVVALGLTEDEATIVACARAGIDGYVTHEATVAELCQRICDATEGEFSCPPRVAAALLRRFSEPGLLDSDAIRNRRLTPREVEIVELLERGLSNQEIARHLTIQLATVKNHVHHILEKLAVRRRADAVTAAQAIQETPPVRDFQPLRGEM